ncbi:MAG: hypothetical protein ABIP65_07160 [Vicinamibacterales bacterium]
MRLFTLAALFLGLSAPPAHPLVQTVPVLDLSTARLVDAAARYVADYEEQLTAVIADESYAQEVRAQVPEERGAPRSRSMRSELFFMFAPFERQWMAIRDVIEIDGAAVAERPDLRGALQTLPGWQVAAMFKRTNSRFNIGRVTRNFNEPTLALLVLDQGHRSRFKFERKRVEKTAGATLVVLEFVERTAPTLIRDLRHRSVYARGHLLVEAGTGRIRRAVLRAEIDALKVELTTDYEADAKLGMWVPSVFRERYEQGNDSRGTRNRRDLTAIPEQQRDYEQVVCKATYSNYRRFEVSSRIK